jgi:hypothetical protein
MLACAAGTAAIIGCSEDRPMKPKAPVLCVSTTGWFVGGRGGVSPVVTVTNCGGGSLSWTAQTEATWLTLSRSSGTAPGSFQITAAANRAEVARADTIRVTAVGASNSPRVVVVSQGPGIAALCVSVSEWDAPPEGATSAPVKVENCGSDTPFGWSASGDFGWLSLSRSDGSAPGDFAIAVAPNYSGADRSAAIMVSAPGIEGSPKTILLSQSFSLLADRTDYEVGYGPVSIAAADFDGDGHTDLAVANALTEDICMLRNRGDGIFASPRFTPIGAQPKSILVADIDGDGKKDIIVLHYGLPIGIKILRNYGDGAFGLPVDVFPEAHPRFLAAADIDADGDEDLALTDGWGSQIMILESRGDGSFAQPVALDLSSIGAVPAGVCFGDVDRDGDPDMMAAALREYSPARLVVLKNKGNGAFESPVASENALLPEASCTLIPSDVDGDGFCDVVAVGGVGCVPPQRVESSVVILKNTGGGMFGARVSWKATKWWIAGFAAADLEPDGDIDLVFVSRALDDNVSVLRNGGAGLFAEPVYFTAGLNPFAIACADLDGDGDADVAVANAGSYTGVYTVTVFRNFTRGPSTVAVE